MIVGDARTSTTDQAAGLMATCPLRDINRRRWFRVPLSLLRTDLAPSAGTLAPA